MKKVLTTFVLLVTIFTSTQASWFSSGIETERERRHDAEARSNQLEQQLQDQRESTQKWQIATGSFAVGCVALLSIGAALGAKVRRDEKES